MSKSKIVRVDDPVESLQPGDRIGIAGVDGQELVFPAVCWSLLDRIERLEDEHGESLSFRVEGASRRLNVRGLKKRLAGSRSLPWLEFQEAGRLRLVVDRGEPDALDGSLVTEQGVRVEFEAVGDQLIVGAQHLAPLGDFQLAMRAIRLGTHGGFEQLICVPLVREMELLDHQLRTAKTVLRRFRGRAMLCDEVGLGKTIEAGLILSELHIRGLVRSVLIITPASLVEQWRGEMRRKFSLDCVTYDDPEFRRAGTDAWSQFDRIIVSQHTAKREPHRSAITDRKWDMVIIDEAHHLRNRNTQMWKFASELQKQFVLLLTATPVQNNLEELFNLVTLLEPGLLSTSKKFQSRFVDRHDKLTPKNVDELHALLGEVMVRNRRSTTGLQFTRRWARTEHVPLTADEQTLYQNVTRFVRQRLQSTDKPAGLNRMVLLTIQMTLGSSSRAAAATLRRLSQKERLPENDQREIAALADQAERAGDGSKVTRLVQLLDEFQDKLVVFTQFLATQEMLAQRLRATGRDVAVFHGGLTRLEKEQAIDRFRGPASVLLCTESGSEGRNLQFAHGVCNFDLPWNPMKIEQRIGRLSRIGQTHDVHVFNLVAAGTVEAAVLHLLEAKLNMFGLVIGEIDMVLGNLDDEREFEDVVAEMWTDSRDDADFLRRMEDLGDRLQAAKQAYFEQRGHDDRLFGDGFAPDK